VPLLQTTADPDGTTIVLDEDGVEPPPLELLQAATLMAIEAAKIS
jgi:hypothetical protein